MMMMTAMVLMMMMMVRICENDCRDDEDEELDDRMQSLTKGIHRTARKRREINMFLLNMYIKAAGMLPNKLLS